MRSYEAVEKMHEVVDRYTEELEGFGLVVSKEEFYSNALLAPTSPESAKFINVTLVIKTEENDDEGGAEHRIGIGVNVKRKNVTEEEFSMAEAEFSRRMKETLEALRASENVEETIAALDKAAIAEYEKIANEYRKAMPKKIIGLIAIIVIAAALLILATYL